MDLYLYHPLSLPFFSVFSTNSNAKNMTNYFGAEIQNSNGRDQLLEKSSK